jgi:predicted 3-demethylubiquinone-9 3-methyltransferase (glyoxalase superfamily)
MDNSYDHQFDFNEGISLVVMTDDQQQTDHTGMPLQQTEEEKVCAAG